jgi:hypothetical protein
VNAQVAAVGADAVGTIAIPVVTVCDAGMAAEALPAAGT